MVFHKFCIYERLQNQVNWRERKRDRKKASYRDREEDRNSIGKKI